MPSKFYPMTANGISLTPISAKKFKHWIGTQEVWFCVHESLEHINQWTVSHWDSGYKVRHINYLTLTACRGDAKAAARMTINQLVEQLGESKVLSTLNSAPKREGVAA